MIEYYVKDIEFIILEGKTMRLKTKLVLLVSTILTISLAVVYVFLSSNANRTVREEVGNRARAITAVVAVAPDIANNFGADGDHARIQEFAETIRKETGVEYVVVFDNGGIRLSHPNPAQIGEHFRGGDEREALYGASYVSSAEGTLGESIRAFQPVYQNGVQVGVVATGISMESVNSTISKQNRDLLLILAVVFAGGLIATLIVAQHIRETLLGMEPLAIARLTVERNTIIQSVREGVIVVDNSGKLLIVNEEAQRIFHQAGIVGDLVGKNSETAIPNTHMLDVVKSGKAEFDQEQRLNDTFILTNRLPLIVEGQIIGALATFRDLAEVRSLAEELTGVKRYVEALRAQAHEFRNKIHVINGLILNKHYDELSSYVQQLALTGRLEMKWIETHVRDTVIFSFLQSKLSRSREMGVNLFFNNDMAIPCIDDVDFQNGLITVLGNLVDNAIDAVQFTELKNVEVFIKINGGEWFIKVCDTGIGVTSNDISILFQKGFSTKGAHRGFGLFLVGRVVEKYNGHIQVDANEPQGTVFAIRLFP